MIVDKNELEAKQKVSAIMLILFVYMGQIYGVTQAVAQDSIMAPWYSLRSDNSLRELDMCIYVCKMLGYVLIIRKFSGYPIFT